MMTEPPRWIEGIGPPLRQIVEDGPHDVVKLAAEIHRLDAREAVLVERVSTLETYVAWLVSMDEPADKQGMADRRTVTLTKIIDRARAVLAELDNSRTEVQS